VKVAKDLIVFDMDGVLVDVTASYRATIQATVLHFSGYEPTPEEIQDWKNRGGWNDDFKLSHALIREHGKDVTYQAVIDRFQEIFHGEGGEGGEGGEDGNGLILKEQWLAAEGLFDRLRERHQLAVFTGRYRWEAHVTLNRFLPNVFDPVIGSDDVQFTKPNPEGLLKICFAVPHRQCWYIGDTVDDARASSAAKVPFIGIASPKSPRHADLVNLLRAEGAIAVLDDINGLEAAIAQNI
jgi:HAD superfamily phosphatase